MHVLFQFVTYYADQRGEEAALAGPCYTSKELAIRQYEKDERTELAEMLDEDPEYWCDSFGPDDWERELQKQMSDLRTDNRCYDGETITVLQEVMVFQNEREIEQHGHYLFVQSIANQDFDLALLRRWLEQNEQAQVTPGSLEAEFRDYRVSALIREIGKRKAE